LVTSGSPGTQLDALARVYAEQLGRRIGQQVIVDNKPGAGGTIASQFIATARPDGYAFEIVSNAQAINATLYQNLPYDTVRDFAGIALGAEAPAVLVVPPSLAVHTLKDFITLAKEKPDTIN